MSSEWVTLPNMLLKSCHLLSFFYLLQTVASDSYQEISYEKNTPFYNLIFSEKFPPSAPTLETKLKVFEPSKSRKNKETVRNAIQRYPEKNEHLSTAQTILSVFKNLKLAFYDCKFW